MGRFPQKSPIISGSFAERDLLGDMFLTPAAVMRDVWAMTHVHMWDMTHACEPWRMCTCETWLMRMRHDSFLWLVPSSNKARLILMRQASFGWDMWSMTHVHMWDMTHACETWLIRVRLSFVVCVWERERDDSSCAYSSYQQLVTLALHISHNSSHTYFSEQLLYILLIQGGEDS